MLIVFSISLFGHALVHRILSSVARDFAFSQHWVRSFSIMNLVVICFLTACVASTPTLLWLFIGILWITLKFFPKFLRFFLIRRLQSALIPLLDCVILGLQTGKSFRSSLHAGIESQSGWVRLQLLEVFESLQHSEEAIGVESALLKGFQSELRDIDRSQNRCLDQVKALRRHYKMLDDFRRRSGQVSQQIKMQAIIVTALYLALFVFVITQFGFQKHKSLLLGSTIVFVAGLFFIFYIGRRMKWKV
ncbi:hypothetical protein EZJ49_06170 [Bdellovibrio bacteriovorus]|uniref:hypothetical protein n=1 Tax=Bdellovibrio bacteriovorus TaxID=959 RepID=UPI0021CF1074|nr:hypothetical protein [Bdellovibrio bacteriovorus]UXR65833.1 hypothetical protein EZJ49_06170 [Bdellovibrio bacteriovorus]